jgi:isopenicillin N synthase-like dioxygenase
MAFTEIPILDLSEAKSADSKPDFLLKLRDALLNVGFLYIKNAGIDQTLYDQVCEEGIHFFDLPDEEKLEIEMKNEASFLGYSRVCAALTHYDIKASLTALRSLGTRSPL